MRSGEGPTVAIIGGGLAGLAAGCALANAGFRITLFERRPYLGGRASSYQHPSTGEVVDNCQHVLLGCCTNLIDLYRRIGVQDKIQWYEELTFLEPGGRASVIRPSSLPAPLHTAPAFLRVSSLNFADKLAIANAMTHLLLGVPRDSGEPFLEWLRRHGQTERAINRFWNTILVSALNEDLEKISVPYAAQVIRESFMKSPEAGRMGVPTIPLSELYGAAGDYVRERGGEVRLRHTVDGFDTNRDGKVTLSTNGATESFEYFVLAVSFDVLCRLLPKSREAQPLQERLSHIRSSPITGIHLWFDRQVTELEHAVLLDRTIQWMFHKSKIQNRGQAGGSYVELVVSASNSLVEKSRGEIVDIALSQLAEFLPAVRSAKLLKSTVIKEIHATYSPQPGVDSYRPPPETGWPRVFLAGDWIQTGWPATMEGAVRGGYLAAEALARSAGANISFVVPDLPARGLMRLFAR